MKISKAFFPPSLTLLPLESAAFVAEPMPPSALPRGLNLYVVERNMPKVGRLNGHELRAASIKTCGVLKALGPGITWFHSYITGDKMYCVYVAANERLVREHAALGGLPVDAVNCVSTIIGPKTAA
ncbi:MAG: DUF4242 domain-containing protein [Opitutus sp.]